jgi:hypothetical protein
MQRAAGLTATETAVVGASAPACGARGLLVMPLARLHRSNQRVHQPRLPA